MSRVMELQRYHSRMPLSVNQLAAFAIEAADDSAVVRHAGEELLAHLGRVDADGGGGVIRLEAGSGPGDGFRLDVRADAVSIRGESPRGALNGVYALLEKAGFAWVEPGDAGVCLRAGGLVPDGVTEERPVFERRTLILGQDALHDDWRGWMEWASRNRLNDLFFHDTPPSRLDRDGAKRPEGADEIAADGRGWMVERWDSGWVRDPGCCCCPWDDAPIRRSLSAVDFAARRVRPASRLVPAARGRT